jgi:tetratricopeptide (TPR) repeat protein
MLAKKNRTILGAMVILALAVFAAGCTPPGPRALLAGKKYLERGDYDGAVAELKTATLLLATNAQAWNYLGVACQRDGQTADAVNAYQHALTLNRDLVEAHYNLGCLWLEQTNFEAAKTEFTAYALRRSNSPEGWLKLGTAQLRGGEIAPAAKSFAAAYYLNTNNAEVLNGLGLVEIKRGHSRVAAQWFNAAIQYHPDYGPAILNLATVAQQYLHDNKLALQNYRAYLALMPRPANWDEVNAAANSIDQPVTVATAAPPPANPNPSVVETAPPPAASVIKTQEPPVVHAVTSPKAPMPVKTYSSPPPPPHPSYPEMTSLVVKVQPEPAIVATPAPQGSTVQPLADAPPITAPAKKTSVWQKLNPVHWFGSSPTPEKKYNENGVTPLPSPDATGSRIESIPLLPANAAPPVTVPPVTVPPAEIKPAKIVPPAPPAFPHYFYLSPRKPDSGDRRSASGAFTKAREFEQDSKWLDAMQSYQQAAEMDPGWFEAQYNFGVLAYRLQDYRLSLAAYETALGIQPDSVNARYNFALALKAAGYVPDAVKELKKIISANPSEARAHLVLGNLFAQQLRDPAQARTHYLKVLELDPHNPQATDIRFWLASNPP